MKLLNCDVNATYGLLDEVAKQLPSAFASAANPSSIHSLGQRARLIVEGAREEIAALLDTNGARIIFTSGATESNNTAIKLARQAKRSADGYSIVTSAIEHPSVLEAVRCSGERYFEAPCASSGAIDLNAVAGALSAETALVSLMLANNETGVINRLKDLVPEIRARAPRAIIHTDAVQAVGKCEISFNALGVDLMSVSAHKIGGLQGSGALIVREGVPWRSFLNGGAQELHFRAGTENVLGICSFGLAAGVWAVNGYRMREALSRNRELLLSIIKQGICSFFENGSGERLPNTLSLRLPGIKGDDLVVALDVAGVCISSGAACASGKPEPSHVLRAMGYSVEEAKESIRISLGAELLEDDVKLIGQKIIEAVRGFRR